MCDGRYNRFLLGLKFAACAHLPARWKYKAFGTVDYRDVGLVYTDSGVQEKQKQKYQSLAALEQAIHSADIDDSGMHGVGSRL